MSVPTVVSEQRAEAKPVARKSIGETPRKLVRKPDTVCHELATGRYQSPPRYPGAKSGLASVIGQLISAATESKQVHRVELFVEPFAGGASTALRLLGSGLVERALLADADPTVAAFWQVAASRTSELIDRIDHEHRVYVSKGGKTALGRWDYWRNWRRRPCISDQSADLEIATRCLFLNRTTFSGILHGQAGPIGGRSQASQYGIGCRFNLPTLMERLRYVGHLYNTNRIVDVWCSDWRTTLAGVASYYKALLPNRVVAYLDPPYLSKSGKLYARSFGVEPLHQTNDLDWVGGTQHIALANHLRCHMPYRWILSYDFDERLLTDTGLYAANAMQPDSRARSMQGIKVWHISKRWVSLNYTAASRTGRGPARELLLTTLPPSTVPSNNAIQPLSSTAAKEDLEISDASCAT